MPSFFGEQLRKGSRSPRHLAAFAGPQLDIMNLRTQGNVTDGQSVAGKNIGIFAAGDRFADFQTYGSNDVALLAIEIGNQSYIGRAIRIVFDLRHASGHTVFVTLEIDDSIETFVTATATADGDPAIVVATRNSRLRLEQRLLRGGGDRPRGQFVPRQISLITPSRRCRC